MNRFYPRHLSRSGQHVPLSYSSTNCSVIIHPLGLRRIKSHLPRCDSPIPPAGHRRLLGTLNVAVVSLPVPVHVRFIVGTPAPVFEVSLGSRVRDACRDSRDLAFNIVPPHVKVVGLQYAPIRNAVLDEKRDDRPIAAQSVTFLRILTSVDHGPDLSARPCSETGFERGHCEKRSLTDATNTQAPRSMCCARPQPDTSSSV